MSSPRNTFLYRNESGTVVLVDLPASIQHGQKSTFAIRSIPALGHPHPSTEPKGKKREVAFAAIQLGERMYHEALQTQVVLALDDIRRHMPNTQWCLRRHELSIEVALPSTAEVVLTVVPVIMSTAEPRTEFASFPDLEGNLVHNPRSTTSLLTISDFGDFFIPPQSTFILATLKQGLPAFARAREDCMLTSEMFDLILMDPPWSNRSVRHSKVYRMQENQAQDPFEEALQVVQEYLKPEGLVAIWVTNKTSVRDLVFASLSALGLHLVEEWIWIKVTMKGEAVSQLDGIWRRPYEILYLFRRGLQSGRPKRRVIAAVPDIHSRKPCLKMLFEELLPPTYTALELFARSLTASWWSWGDEVLRFQHESQWVI